jgi:hypothetical protein
MCPAAWSDQACVCLPGRPPVVDVTADPDLSWVMFEQHEIVWPWWLAVPAARVRRWVGGRR